MSETQKALVNLNKVVKALEIQQAAANRDRIVQKIEIDLSEERPLHDPLVFNSGFKSIYFESCIEISSGREVAEGFVYFKPNDATKAQDEVTLKYNSSWVVENMVSRAYFFWPKQENKKIVLKVFFDSEYRSGSQVSVYAGNIQTTPNYGSTHMSMSSPVPSAMGTMILPVQLDRKAAIIQNQSTQKVYLTDSFMDTLTGFLLEPGKDITWFNNGALYARADANVGRVAIQILK